MRIRLAIPDRLVTPEALEAALEATSLANEQAIRRGEVPLITDAIRKGVRWKPEPYLDGEHFDLAHHVAARNWGDCDDLAPWLTGQLRATGEDPGARSRVYKSGPDRWHVVTETSDGEILDPSRWAGMGKRKSQTCSNGVCGVTAQPFARLGEGALCCVPHRGKYWSRVDLPFPQAAGHIASHASARTPEESLNRAIAGAIACGEQIDSELCDRARVLGAMLLGEFDQQYLEGEIGKSPFGFLGKLVKKALPFAASFVPGIGPIAKGAIDTGLNMVDKMGKKKKGAAPETSTVVRALTHGGGQPTPTPDTIVHTPTGAVSVPISTPSVPPPGEPPPGKPAMIFYHPANAIGPVVVRF
jgi:hypothetical protein